MTIQHCATPECPNDADYAIVINSTMGALAGYLCTSHRQALEPLLPIVSMRADYLHPQAGAQITAPTP